MRSPYLIDTADAMRTVIRQWVATNRFVIPVSVESILRQLGWPVVEMPMPEGLQASTLFDYRTIFINEQLSPLQQRFALAHELIHALYHQHHVPRGVVTLAHNYHGEMETEANSGAAELLLPYDWFMDTAHSVLGSRLCTLEDLDGFIETSEARRWAGQARVTRQVLRYHLIDLGWVGSDAHALSTLESQTGGRTEYLLSL